MVLRITKIIYFLFMGFLPALPITLLAVPRLAVQNGVSCITCHLNPTGGGLRNEYGSSVVSLDELPLLSPSKQPAFTGALSDHLRVGMDFRMQSYVHSEVKDQWEIVLFPMQLELYGHWLVTSGLQAYAAVDAIRSNSEVWVSVEVKKLNGYFRAGKMIPHFGLALDDHTTFVRGGNIKLKNGLNAEGMIFTPLRSLVNTVETGINLGNFFITGSISDGYVFSESKKRTLAGRVEYSGMFREITMLAGGSVIEEGNFLLLGLFSGFARGSFAWMGEVNIADNWVGDGSSIASFNELSYGLFPGLTVTARYDFFDENIKYLQNAISRITAGIEFFPIPYVEIRSQVRVTQVSFEKSSKSPEFITQVHLWF